MSNVKLSIIIPVFNEVNTVTGIVNNVLDAPFSKEIIIVDDGSTDGTPDSLKQIERSGKEITVIYKSSNCGKGAALREGFKYVTDEKPEIFILKKLKKTLDLQSLHNYNSLL